MLPMCCRCVVDVLSMCCRCVADVLSMLNDIKSRGLFKSIAGNIQSVLTQICLLKDEKNIESLAPIQIQV